MFETAWRTDCPKGTPGLATLGALDEVGVPRSCGRRIQVLLLQLPLPLLLLLSA